MNTRDSIRIDSMVLGYENKILIEESTLCFRHGEFTALIGRNGTGKSTLLKAIAGLLKPLSGTIGIDGTDINDIAQKDIAAKISLVSTEDIKIQNLSVKDAVALGRSPYTNWFGTMTDKDNAVVMESLELVGMVEFASRSIDSLSDGERQRTMIARALAQDTPIILLDEPTAFLDISNKYAICLLLRELAHKQGKCVICSTHDLSISLELCDNVALIADKRFYCGTAENIISEGIIQRLFDGTNLIFDINTRSIRPRT